MKMVFHQDIATVHQSTVAMSKLMELKLEVLPHPPHPPHLSPSDFVQLSMAK